MARILLMVLCLVAVIVAYRTLRSRRRDSPSDAAVDSQQPMVRCAHCGVFVPESEALRDGTERFCSEAHRLSRSPK